MNILLVEDDLFFQKFYAQKLRQETFGVDVASDGDEALKKLSQTKYDLILLDIIMPKKSGFDVLEYLKTNPPLNTAPIIVFSTLGQEQDIKKALQLGAKDYINKTFFDFSNLLNKINILINDSKKAV
jgi:DNA-binding response OmpR family regulator